jgi:hypothetical protein
VDSSSESDYTDDDGSSSRRRCRPRRGRILPALNLPGALGSEAAVRRPRPINARGKSARLLANTRIDYKWARAIREAKTVLVGEIESAFGNWLVGDESDVSRCWSSATGTSGTTPPRADAAPR